MLLWVATVTRGLKHSHYSRHKKRREAASSSSSPLTEFETFSSAPDAPPPPSPHRGGKRGRGRASKRLVARESESMYAGHYRSLLSLEREEEEVLARERIESWSEARLRTAGLALFGLEAKRRRDFYGRGVVRLFFREKKIVHKLSPGDLVTLSCRDQRLDGVLLNRDACFVDVVLSSPGTAHGKGWRLDQCYSTVSYERMEAAVSAVTARRDGDDFLFATRNNKKTLMVDDVSLDLRRVIVSSSSVKDDRNWLDLARSPCPGLGRKAASESSVRSALARVAKLDPSQKRAAVRALRQRVALIQGPPGTGKTKVAAAIAAASVNLRDKELSRFERGIIDGHGGEKKRVLACAASNVATDNLLEQILALGVDAVRVGHPASTRPDLRNATLDARVEALGSSTTSDKTELAARILRKADVVVASCVGAGGDVFRGLQFGLVVIDEAAQATEPCCLVPITAALGASQLILVGDQMQLPPTIVSQNAKSGGLGLSMFARFFSAGLTPELLTKQYRMHPSLNDFSSARFYRNRVETCPKIERDRRTTPPPKGFKWPRPDEHPLAFVSCIGEQEHQLPGGSIVNPAQAVAVADLVRNLLEAGDIQPEDLAVVTPYAAQARAITDIVDDPRVEIGTVDGLQGREKDVVLVSAVRSNDRRAVGFLADFRRLNVALTRARRALVVFGDQRTLQADPNWAAFIDHCHSLRVHCTATHSPEL